MELSQTHLGVRPIHWRFAQTHPVLAFLFIAFGWTWLFWLGAIPLRGQNDLLVMTMVLAVLMDPRWDAF